MNFLLSKLYEFKSVWNEYSNSRRIKFVWGIKSSFDFTGQPANLYTLNDFEIDYLPKTKKYIYGVETMYMFDDREAEVGYIKQIYKIFTHWMHKKGYKTDCEPSVFSMFTACYGEGFDTIEELYADFKLKCSGFFALNFKKKGNRNDTKSDA